jgi:hypothetical protein
LCASLIAGLTILFFSASVFAGEIREFDLKTKERLGNELAQASQRPDRGATSQVRKQAQQTAMAALKGKLSRGVRYDYVVLADPDGSGFLVYALIAGKSVIGGHVRVTVSGDGSTVKRIERLSRGVGQPSAPAGATRVSSSLFDPDNTIPDETYVYTNRITGVPIYVGFKDNSIWEIANGKITKLKEKLH